MGDRSFLSMRVVLRENQTREEVVAKVVETWGLEPGYGDTDTIAAFEMEQAYLGTCDEIFDKLVNEKWDWDVVITQDSKYECEGRLAMYAGSTGKYAIMDAFESRPLIDIDDLTKVRNQLPEEYRTLLDDLIHTDLRSHFSMTM
ncbi:hypothetical protein [Ferrimicrobium acidiphilum]|uniref:hypothetical protein n=1 Tax=Ferrimicrobium acidiphilum TaxID=121039 RepID=UPI0023F3EEEE|nr:hypothetical protein [Ferrimicrobium acidiphilum]